MPPRHTLDQIPSAVAWLGYGGLVPFIGLAMTLPGLDAAERIRLFVWSTVPALIAWPALLVSTRLGALILVAG